MKNTLKIMILIVSCTSMISYSAARDGKGKKPTTQQNPPAKAIIALQSAVKKMRGEIKALQLATAPRSEGRR